MLGLSVFALAGGTYTLLTAPATARFAGRAMPVTAWYLIGVGALFAVLWLSEIVPDLLAGDPSRSARAWNVPTNPVHVLDLALFLPAVITSGVLLLRRRPFGYATAPGQLVWLALTCLPILITPFVANTHAHNPGWAVMIPIGVLLIATLAVLGVALRRVIARAGPSPRAVR